jgi:hypothetical protein
MKSKTFALTLALCFLATGACFANPQMGTWKLNAAKSKIAHGMGKNNTVSYDWAFFRVKVTIDGVDARGKAVHNEWVGNFDGKDYPVTGDPKSDARAYTRVDDRTMNFVIKKGGKVMSKGRIVVSADGNTRTVTNWAPNSKGKWVTSTAVYDRA